MYFTTAAKHTTATATAPHLPLHVDTCRPVANLKCLHTGLDDRGKDRFTLVGVCKHVRDLVQEAEENMNRITTQSSDLIAAVFS